MYHLTLNGSVVINGKKTVKLYGGFGDNQPCILAKQVAELHDYELKEINQLVNNNLNWFDKDIDYLDLKNSVISNDRVLTEFFSRQSIANSEHIFLFSQQGYALLCKLLKSDLAKQIYKQMVRDYFRLREKKVRQFSELDARMKASRFFRQIITEGKQAGLKKQDAVLRAYTAAFEQTGYDFSDALPENFKSSRITPGTITEEKTLGQFIRECCETADDFKIKAGELYKAYLAWAAEKK